MVAKELHISSNALRPLRRLNPLAMGVRDPDGAEKAPDAIFGVGTVVLAHDGFDSLGGLVAVPEGQFGKVVVDDVGFDDAVHKVAADEAEFAVDCGGGAAGEGPGCWVVVGEGGVGVLEEGYPYCVLSQWGE